jgi:methylthioribose-1-phosphate isomerase
MFIHGKSYRTIWPDGDGLSVRIIDQTLLPHQLETRRLGSVEDVAEAITTMRVRGAPLIGATAAYGYALAARDDASDGHLITAVAMLAATRPTAVNLRWALDRMDRKVRSLPKESRTQAAFAEAKAICDEDVVTCEAIGVHGAGMLRAKARAKGGARINILTHCNAGWLACVDWGTALAPVYKAHDEGIALHVWVDETRPRNQGASLTAFELDAHGVPFTVIADNAGGHLMQGGQVDLCIVGSDRTANNGDVANKIGTYLKAIAALDQAVPFYVALPSSTIDWSLASGVGAIPIEDRSEREVTHMTGMSEQGDIVTIAITPPGTKAANPAFDVTPARYVTALITERGIAGASRDGLLAHFPERRA